MNYEKQVTILVTGETGSGKSSFLNSYVEDDNAFVQSDDYESTTTKTEIKSYIKNGIKRNCIDTPGSSSSDGKDEEYSERTINFLQQWDAGINACFIVINVHNCRFSQSIKVLIQRINQIYNNPEFWKQTGIIFTHCYGNYKYNPKYQKAILDFILNLDGCDKLELNEIPCFFVDSTEWRIDKETKSQINRIFEFAEKNKALPTEHFKNSHPLYKSTEDIFENNHFIRSVPTENGSIEYFENRKKEKRISWDDQISYGEYETIHSWTLTHEIIDQEEVVLINTRYEGSGIEIKKIFTYEHLKKERIISSDGSTKINIISRTKTIKEKGVDIKHKEDTVKESRKRHHPCETPGEIAATCIGHFLTLGVSTICVGIADSIYDDYWVKYEWDEYFGPDGNLIRKTPRRETSSWRA